MLGPKTDSLMQEVELKVTSISEQIQLERPFQTVVRLQSHVDRQLGPLTLTTASGKPWPPFSCDCACVHAQDTRMQVHPELHHSSLWRSFC